MKRREALKWASLSGLSSVALAPLASLAAQTGEPAGDGTETGAAMLELLDVLQRKDLGFENPAWRLGTPDMLAEGRLMLLHTLNHALDVWLAADPARPMFKRWHFPDKKLFGDNPDAIYYEAPVDANTSYLITGNIEDATYTSFTVELARGADQQLAKLGATLNDTEFETDAEGNYEILVSAKPQKGNWLKLDPNAASITTRHYYEFLDSAAADPQRGIPMRIDPVIDPGPAAPPSDKQIAANIRRIAIWLDNSVNPPGQDFNFPWVSRVPNQLPKPTRDKVNEEIGYAAKDNIYAMAPWLLQPDQALVIRGRWPKKARFANVVLWNLFLQSLDYRHRNVSLNRKQTALEEDGSFKIILAHQDPGLPNWLDTEGRPIGMMFWRFQLAEEDIEPLVTEVLPFASLSNS